jgi:hypothetical protein
MRIFCSLVLTIATIASAQSAVPTPKPVSPVETTTSTRGLTWM